MRPKRPVRAVLGEQGHGRRHNGVCAQGPIVRLRPAARFNALCVIFVATFQNTTGRADPQPARPKLKRRQKQ